MAISGSMKAIALTLIVVVVVFGAYTVATYPRTAVSFPVSFTVGAERETVKLNVPWLLSQAQVEIKVQSGTALWAAGIISGNHTVWSHSAIQGGQTTYTSEWMELPDGQYNFTFRTLGIGSLEAEIKVTTKGGFW
jgi:hypothetical protein